MYGILTTFIAALSVFFVYTGFFKSTGIGGFLAAIGVSIIEVIMLSILRSLFTTRYILTKNKQTIERIKLIRGIKKFLLTQ